MMISPIGAAVHAARERCRLSREELAARADVTIQGLTALEEGRGVLSTLALKEASSLQGKRTERGRSHREAGRRGGER
jgi:DNA-binding XRE family transcriptional regulator